MQQGQQAQAPQRARAPKHRPKPPTVYEDAVASSGTFLTVLSLLTVTLALVTTTCSARLTKAYLTLLILTLFAIAIISLFLVCAAMTDYKNKVPKKIWSLSIAFGWLLFAIIAAVMASFTAAEYDSIMLSACKMCPEGFGGGFDNADVVKVCGQYLN